MSIKIEELEVSGFKASFRGMRNPKDSWHLSDSNFNIKDPIYPYQAGPKDLKLANQLHVGGPVHSKYKRFLIVTMDITAPLYWWKEFDTYKVGTVANSCSTMHKITAYEFTLDMFSREHLLDSSLVMLKNKIIFLNGIRERYLYVTDKIKNEAYIKDSPEAWEADERETKELQKTLWWQLIQSLPSSFNQKRTVQISYENVTNMVKWRANHKQDEWRIFCNTMSRELPYYDLICDPNAKIYTLEEIENYLAELKLRKANKIINTEYVKS